MLTQYQKAKPFFVNTLNHVRNFSYLLNFLFNKHLNLLYGIQLPIGICKTFRTRLRYDIRIPFSSGSFLHGETLKITKLHQPAF